LSTTPVDLSVETLQVGPSGTETLSTDEARIFLGKGAVLEKEVSLRGKTARRRQAMEKVLLQAELRPVEFTSAGLSVALQSKVRVLATTTGGVLPPRGEISRTTRVEILRGGSQLMSVYESADLDMKLTLNLRWSLPEESRTGKGPPVPIDFAIRVFEITRNNEVLLSENQLPTLLGHQAVTTVERVVPVTASEGDGKRARQDKMEITLFPRYLADRSLSVGLTIKGDLVTLTPDENYAHPLAYEGNYLLSPLLPETVEMEVSSDSLEKEGWERVRFRFEILAKF